MQAETVSNSSEEPLTVVITPETAGGRFDRTATAAHPELSRSRVQALIESGNILLNGESARTSTVLRAGDRITVTIPPSKPVEGMIAEDIAIDVLFEDESLLVVNKPAGLVVHPGAGNPTGTLVQALMHHTGTLSVIGGVERPGIVHRLDKETSGCLVVAKSDAAHRFLAEQFANRTIEKTYLAITAHHPPRREGVIVAGIARHPINRQKMTVSDRDSARPATTEYRTIASGNGLFLLECKPKTGRTHQIRVHLQHIRCPIVGDPLYGKRDGHARHLLHAWKVTFVHPDSLMPQTVIAPIPPDFPLAPPEK